MHPSDILDWPIGQEKEVSPGHYATAVADAGQWRLWRFESRPGKVLVAGLPSEGGRPPVPLGVGSALFEEAPFATIEFAQPRLYRFHGLHAHAFIQYRAVGDRFMTVSERRKDFTNLDGQLVEAMIVSSRSTRATAKSVVQQARFDFTGALAIVAAAEAAG